MPTGRYAIISQWSAGTGQMRVGLWNPATRVLTWSAWAAYRGFFPIYGTGSQQRLRWCYGLTGFPIGIGEMGWFNRILSNSEILQFCEETKI